MFNPAAADRVWQAEFGNAETSESGRQPGKGEGTSATGEEAEDEGPAKKKVG